eukprot:9307671-Pyramimonas_sp.AAC.1
MHSASKSGANEALCNEIDDMNDARLRGHITHVSSPAFASHLTAVYARCHGAQAKRSPNVVAYAVVSFPPPPV